MTIAELHLRWAHGITAALIYSICLAMPAAAQGSASRQETGDALTPKLELMLKSMRIARDWHVGKPAKPVLVAGAIEGLLAKIDPEAELYTRAELRRIARFMATNVADVGLEVRREPPLRRQERPGYRVVSSRDGSPAAVAGLKAGDLITHIDGKPAGELLHLAAQHLALAGTIGSRVRLTIERAGHEAAEEAVLERTAASSPALEIDEAATGVARLRVVRIDGATEDGLRKAIEALPGRATRGLVLDLRSTAGGDAQHVASLADAFLQGGPVLRIAARAADGLRQAEATPGDVIDGRPMVVLVDAGTSGAAEALAAALKESHRARLVGGKTAGRGAIRTLIPLGSRGEKGVLRLTTERLLTASGAPIESKGLVPDVVVEQAPASTACRSLDIEDDTRPGHCVRRAVAADAQLLRAIGLLDEAMVAEKGATAPPRP